MTLVPDMRAEENDVAYGWGICDALRDMPPGFNGGIEAEASSVLASASAAAPEEVRMEGSPYDLTDELEAPDGEVRPGILVDGILRVQTDVPLTPPLLPLGRDICAAGAWEDKEEVGRPCSSAASAMRAMESEPIVSLRLKSARLWPCIDAVGRL